LSPRKLSEKRTRVVENLKFVLDGVRRGRFMSGPTVEDAIRDLTLSATWLREDITPEGEEADICKAFVEARDAAKIAAERLDAYFWPLAKACATEQEARDLIARVPYGAMAHVWLMDYFVYKSGIIPKVGARG
jgi:hypothetical protein